MRATTLLLTAALTLSSTAVFAQSSYNVVVEPVTPTVDAIINAPVEYDDNGVVKAQHFNADNLTDAQYQELIDEAARIRAYRAANGISYESQYVDVVSPTQPQIFETSPSYEIDLFAPSVAVAPTTSVGVSSLKTHTVSKGDTLYNISKRYDASIAEIQAENGMSGTALSLGQKIRIPGVIVESINTVAQPIFASAPVVSAPMSETYVTRRVVVEPAPNAIAPRFETTSALSEAIYAVLPKDTLYAISRRTCVGVKDIISHNKIDNPNALTPGQRITLPAGHCLTR